MALGDNWKGHRIVGTTTDYLKHYKAQLNDGRYWKKSFEVVVGSSVKLKINDEFIGVHGLVEDGNSHKDEKYKVIGILKPSGTVLDRLILTSVNSVLSIHGLHEINDTINKNTLDPKMFLIMMNINMILITMNINMILPMMNINMILITMNINMS